MSGPKTVVNLQTYEAHEVVEHYASLDYLTPCERLLFDAYIPQGSAILDLGVGGGRTTSYLTARASHYVGVDYSTEMVKTCRDKFPALQFAVADAADLSVFPDASFDAVVFAFNGIDYVLPDDRRRNCLRHIDRVLKTRGVLIFSSHNPRAVIVRRTWNQTRLRSIARRYSVAGVHWPLWMLLASARAAFALAATICATLRLAASRIPSSTFWRGEGTLLDPVHGGLLTHYASPTHVLTELSTFRFRLERILGDDYPRTSSLYATGWYYYVFRKTCEK